MTDLTNNPICSVLASQIADQIAEIASATGNLDYALERKQHWKRELGADFVPSFIEELIDDSCKRIIAAKEYLASIGIDVQEAHDRRAANAEAAA